ncbi:DUF4111 domain-containing protein [Paenibacillus sp. JCM 10914]|uniref:aminoglycoside adenylyltransferase domain-containing protein n=1 Tax=Paenibacillus sp. JCM 10914 TaxID=1236974 RepID=UPI0003CC3952|nr:aminoglycoside adenylyltransferase domain-containing protein [Paenibacillus sp. JCM 10914]GAE04096.1 streptomycin 3''-adenylyltransferase, putative [Paenibacillus sp. JCM 10914]
MQTQAILDPFIKLSTEEFGSNLVGIYLHGSMAMGCFNPATSDIDLLLVIQDHLSKETAKRFGQRLLTFHDRLSNQGGIELSIVLEDSIENMQYPPLFEFHYSNVHREKYRDDPDYICGGFGDHDLAAHYTVIYHRGVTLYGKPIHQVFKRAVDPSYYRQAIIQDVASAASDIAELPLYFTLNLCRVLYYLRENIVSSKQEGGEWGLRVLPAPYHGIIRQALLEYGGISDSMDIPEPDLIEYAQYMLGQIHQASGQTPVY